MEQFLAQIEWLPTLVAFTLAFGLGIVWYSPVGFLTPWLDGLPSPPKWRAPMWIPMVAQALSTLMLAVLLHFALQSGHTVQAVLIVLTVAGFLEASGFYTGKTVKAVAIEVGYILSLAMVMFVVFALF